MDMTDIPFIILTAVFGFAAGLALGAGNYRGLKGAIIPGIITGLVFAIPSLREHHWLASAIITGGALAGSIACVFVGAENRFKRLVREQKMLVIRAGSYKLGKNR